MPIFATTVDSIGRVSLVRINHLAEGSGATLLAKIEGRNPGRPVRQTER